MKLRTFPQMLGLATAIPGNCLNRGLSRMRRIFADFWSSDLLGGNCLNRDLWDSMICRIMRVGCGLDVLIFFLESVIILIYSEIV